jgi:RiboL-PSP-HEPN
VPIPWSGQQLIQELDQLLERAREQEELQVQSDYAKFLVIRVNGLIEQVIVEIVLHHIQTQASPTVMAHLSWRMNSFQNPNIERVLQLVGSFNRRWREELDDALTEEERQALGSLNAQRNKIAHGQQSTISLAQVNEYYAHSKLLLGRIADLFS